MRKHYEAYSRLLEDNGSSAAKKYWDLVVITSINEEQKRCYEKQIQTKLERSQIPKCFEYKVISDPDDCKIGSGGSTINLTRVLYESYGDRLFEMKILLIHAGGYSQRMPTCTVLGKIFSSLAVDDSHINDLLDLKLASFLPFSVNMAPGIYLTASDDFATFDYDEQVEYSRLFGHDGNDFILLAHKSSLTVGKDHGVYALDKSVDKETQTGLKNVFDCKFVLQKPPIERMRALNVVEKDENGEFVFTDSSFYMSHRVTRALTDIYVGYFNLIQHEKIEVCAYRDFLQPLGSSPLPIEDYLKSASAFDENRQRLFKDMYSRFKGSKSLVIGLTNSKFYHLGTVNELFDSYLNPSDPEAIQFRQDLCFTRFKPSKEGNQQASENGGVVLFSRFNAAVSQLSSMSLMEYCFFDERTKLVLNDYSFLSNCMVNYQELLECQLVKESSDQVYTVPANVCMHTLSIKEPKTNSNKYVTIFFNKNDDLKKVYADFAQLSFLGQALPSKYERIISTSKASALPPSIWNLKVFQAYSSMSESFHRSIAFIHEYLEANASEQPTATSESQLYSLFDLLHLKDFQPLISFRTNYKLI